MYFKKVCDQFLLKGDNGTVVTINSKRYIAMFHNFLAEALKNRNVNKMLFQ